MNRTLLAAVATMLVAGCSAKQNADSGAAPAAPPAPAAQTMGGGPDMAMMTPDPNDSAATKGYKAAMMKAMTDAPKSFTGNADIDFIAHMRVHHQAAIDMAAVELANGQDPAAKDLARKITAAQKAEIATMNAWLKQKGQ